MKKYDTNKNCLQIRKYFEKIKVLEENYKIECDKFKEFRQSLKLSPALYNEVKKELSEANEHAKKLQLKLDEIKKKYNLNNVETQNIIFYLYHQIKDLDNI